ncbi:OmpA family protein [Leptospira sp. GIMC2001]|uniref:OmpA family protein n=1 Tax=Leptospira sp. GIMC2001 TaxID=1513297 RepID=UPI0023494404|nr:OmpA family protein [Leptospira sp. GIMC2001]WCL49508.1 OmpA family protein [Leptospira sp. GIMC2001]
MVFRFKIFFVVFVIHCLLLSNSVFAQSELVVEEIRGNVNTSFQEFSPSLSTDGQTLYFYSKRDRNSYTDIFSSNRKTDGTWDFPKEVVELNSEFDDQSPFITADGKYIYFSSNRDGSWEARLANGKIGISRDIYVSEKVGNGWSDPQPLPIEINSDMIEENPHVVGDTMLFTRYPFSQPELARIYISKKQGNKWTPAVALSGPVNDANATIAASLSDDQKNIFFSSNRQGGFGGFDLYSANWDGTKAVGSIENLGSDFNTKGDEAYFSYHRLSKTILFCRREEGKNFNIFSAYIPKTIEQNLVENKKISLDNINFEKSSHELLDSSKIPLNQIVEYMKKNSSVKIRIIGHTDLNGNLEDNMKLSRDRANSVKEYIVKQGIKSTRLETEGKGPNEPLYQGTDENVSKKNRRTEFEILN